MLLGIGAVGFWNWKLWLVALAALGAVVEVILIQLLRLCEENSFSCVFTSIAMLAVLPLLVCDCGCGCVCCRFNRVPVSCLPKLS